MLRGSNTNGYRAFNTSRNSVYNHNTRLSSLPSMPLSSRPNTRVSIDGLTLPPPPQLGNNA